MTEQPWQSWEVFLLTKLADSFLILFVDASIDQRTERTLSHCRKDALIYRTNRPVEKKTTNSFLIRLLLTKYNCSAESFLIWLVYIDINQSKQHIPCHCRNYPVNNRGNWPAEPNQLNIRDFSSSLFYKLTKRRSLPADQMSWVISHIICWRQH